MDYYQGLAENFATQVKKLRERGGHTQAEIAGKAGVTVETVARVERVLKGGRASANSNPTLETMARLAVALDVEPLDLLKSALPAFAQTDRLDRALKRASQTVRNTLAVIAEALVADEGLTWGYHSGATPHPGMTRSPTSKKKAKKKPARR